MASLPALPHPSARVYPKFWLQHALPATLALVPLAYLVRMCAVHYVDVPFWDQWAMVPRLAHMASGTLSLHDFWMQHNEHRPLVPVAVMLALARLSGWNIGWEIAVNVLLGTGTFLLFWRHLATSRGAALWLLPVISLLVFSPIQWENWTWGWQMQVLMCAFASLLAAYLVSRSAQRIAPFAAAAACAVWATYSFASGIIVWVALLPGIWLTGGRGRPARLAVWIAVGAITCASYFYDYQRPPQPSMLSTLASLSATWHAVLYVLTYLGSPVSAFDNRWAPYAGGALLAAFLALTFELRAFREDPALLFPALVGLQTLGIAAASALGRAWMGVDQALSSRYCSLSIPMWCALLCLAAFRRTALPSFRGQPVVAAVLLAALLFGTWASGRIGVYQAAGRGEMLRFARRGLIVGRSNALLLILFPNLEIARERRAVLLRLHFSVFRPAGAPAYPLPGPA